MQRPLIPAEKYIQSEEKSHYLEAERGYCVIILNPLFLKTEEKAGYGCTGTFREEEKPSAPSWGSARNTETGSYRLAGGVSCCAGNTMRNDLPGGELKVLSLRRSWRLKILQCEKYRDAVRTFRYRNGYRRIRLARGMQSAKLMRIEACHAASAKRRKWHESLLLACAMAKRNENRYMYVKMKYENIWKSR